MCDAVAETAVGGLLSTVYGRGVQFGAEEYCISVYWYWVDGVAEV